MLFCSHIFKLLIKSESGFKHRKRFFVCWYSTVMRGNITTISGAFCQRRLSRVDRFLPMLQVEVCFLCFCLVSRRCRNTLTIYQLEKLSRIENLNGLFQINWIGFIYKIQGYQDGRILHNILAIGNSSILLELCVTYKQQC